MDSDGQARYPLRVRRCGDVQPEPAAAGGNDRYEYDGNSTLVRRTLENGAWAVYIGGAYELHSDGSVVKYYTAMGKTIAVRSAGTLSYLLQDQLGSTVGVMDTSGAVTGTQTYWPYGATRTSTGVLAGTAPTDRQYTGQQQEAPASDALGLYDYKARFYSTVLGRFVSADSVTKDGWNRYEYVRDDPATRLDPTGSASYPAGDGNGCDLSCGLQLLAQLRDSLPTQAQRDAFTKALEGSAPEFDEAQMSHAYRDAPGHWNERRPERDALLQETASDPANLVGITKGGMRVYAKIQPDGTQVWVYVGRDSGKIRDGGLNDVPLPFDKEGHIIRTDGDQQTAEAETESSDLASDEGGGYEPPPGAFLAGPTDNLPGAGSGGGGCSFVDPETPCD